jgi:hypothetical protein
MSGSSRSATSELGHRALAHGFTSLLHDTGLLFGPPGLGLDGTVAGTWHDLQWMISEGGPWLGRRARDLAPGIARDLVLKTFTRLDEAVRRSVAPVRPARP